MFPDSKPIVYFGSVRSISRNDKYAFVAKFDSILEKLGITDSVKDKNVAVKMHLGIHVGFSTVHPFLIGRLVNAIKEAGGKPFVVGTMEEVPSAVQRGYTPEVVGCPILAAAGPADRYYVEEEINYKGLKTLKMGGIIRDADVLVGISHVKGHNSIGYGAAIKNIAVGCFTQETRLAMHRTMQHDRYWDKQKSRDAEVLVKSCPYGSIQYKDGKLTVSFDFCNQCMRCISADTDGCLQIKPENFLSFVEINALAAQFVLSHFDKDARFFINVATDISAACDCWGMTSGQILTDLGVFGSKDIVAIDKATLDMLADKSLIKENVPQRDFEVNDDPELHPFARIHGPYKDPYNMIRFAERYGLGSPDYVLEEVLRSIPDPEWPPARFPGAM